MENTVTELVERLQGLQEASDLKNADQARQWLQKLPAPSGWFSAPEEDLIEMVDK